MTQQRTVAVLGATGTVGQRFISLLADHPWFKLTALTTSERRAGKRYADAVHWHLPEPMPESVANMKLEPTRPDLEADLCFSALPTEAAQEHEAALAKAGHHVFSNASTHRMDADVPNLLAEVNFEHVKALARQREARGWRGSIVTNGNCTAIHLALALAPLFRDFGIDQLVVTTMQSISGAGYPGVPSLDVLDNVVPYIGGEEEKVVEETQKFLGSWDSATGFVPAPFSMSVHCNRVLVRDGHTETVSVHLTDRPGVDAVKASLRKFTGRPQELGLPSAPTHPIVVRDEPDRPQPLLDRDTERGMASTVGRVREDPVLGTKFVLVGHNTIRGAAGASVLNAELLVAERCV
ncbi:MAG TPA: aspartate-semialdehyde dehydrogenase [Candidatus Limnocylindria bacterium]|nr:aspartate-semialdehyde dehydrogenase [Candidatus Limnocylindria bacterium]